MGLLIYVDMMSQPCRAVVTFCKENNIPYELKLVNIAKGENRTKEFRAINPLGKLPVIDDNGFILAESHAILRYLCSTRNVPNHWFPQEPKQRAIVNRYLDWHPVNIRYPISTLVFGKVFAPKLQITVEPSKLNEARTTLKSSLRQLESWLSQSQYLAGERISIADLSAAEEIYMYLLVESDFLLKYPRIAQWLKHLRSELKSWGEVHSVFHKLLAKQNPDALKLRLDRAQPDLQPGKQATMNEANGTQSNNNQGEWSSAANKMVAGKIFSELKAALSTDGKDAVEKLKAIVRFVITKGSDTVTWTLNLKEGNGSIVESADGKADVTFQMSDDVFLGLATGQQNPQTAFMMRRLKLQGNVGKAMQFNTHVFQKQKAKVIAALEKLGLMKPKSKL